MLGSGATEDGRDSRGNDVPPYNVGYFVVAELFGA
jgi:hypothetical protein